VFKKNRYLWPVSAAGQIGKVDNSENLGKDDSAEGTWLSQKVHGSRTDQILQNKKLTLPKVDNANCA